MIKPREQIQPQVQEKTESLHKEGKPLVLGRDKSALVLAQKQTCESAEQNKKHRNTPRHIQMHDL